MSESKKKIKLLVGISDFRIGGAQKIVADIIKRIDADTFEIHLVTFFQSSNEDDFYALVPDHIAIHKLQFTSFSDSKSWYAVYALLRQLKPDVVWSHLFFSNTILRVLKPFFNYKVITVEHNTYVSRSFAERFTNFILSFVTQKIVAVSDQVKEYLKQKEWIKNQKIVVVLNGVDVTFYSNQAQSTDVGKVKVSLGFVEEDKVIISVGQLIKQKNHQLLVDTFAEFIKIYSDYKLIIIGEGSERNELESKIHQYGIENKVKLLGIQKNTPMFYAISDFFVFPSRFEGFGLVCIEAMASGLPVITTRVAGPDTYITDTWDGYFFEPTISDLFKKMSLIAGMDIESRVEMSRNAREKAFEYNITSTVLNYQLLLKNAVT